MSILAHELREPLASILFAVEFTKETRHDESASRKMCEIIERQVRYLARIIEDVLDVSRGEQGKIVLYREFFDVRSIISTCVETTGPLIAKRRHHLSVFLPREPVYLMADPLRLQQVVNNLLTNAARYTEPGGSIHLTVEVAGEKLIIEVRDDGIGISPSILPQVFELFRQGGEERRRDGGLGIGLALVQLLVELHGGSVTAHSEGEGTGSSFVVSLPGAIKICRDNPDLTTEMTRPNQQRERT
jgi:signal transduction histidine kinase